MKPMNSTICAENIAGFDAKMTPKNRNKNSMTCIHAPHPKMSSCTLIEKIVHMITCLKVGNVSGYPLP